MNFILPFNPAIRYVITQTFDEHELLRKKKGWTNYNGGIDYYFYDFPIGTPIIASEDADVLEAKMDPSKGGGYGNYAKLLHANGFKTLYGHLDHLTVSTGRKVFKGDLLGYSGNTGNSTGPHTHFEMRNANNVPVNPEIYLNNPEPIADYSMFEVIAAGVRARSLAEINDKNILFTPSIGMKMKKGGALFVAGDYTWQPGLIYIATQSKDGKTPYIRG